MVVTKFCICKYVYLYFNMYFLWVFCHFFFLFTVLSHSGFVLFYVIFIVVVVIVYYYFFITMLRAKNTEENGKGLETLIKA